MKLLAGLLVAPLACAFAPRHQRAVPRTILEAANKQSTTLEEEAAPAGIGGAQFFGGNKQKEEFYDAAAELKSGDGLEYAGIVNRFEDRAVFDSEETAALASSIQSQIQATLYDTEDQPDMTYSYASSLQWTSPISKTATPMAELEAALEFYDQVDIAITNGKKVDDSTHEMFWEISVSWPTFWLPRVLLMGSSTVRLDGTSIVAQNDKLSNSENVDLLNQIGSQITPRFWDWYHVGMSPCAERLPLWNKKKSPFSPVTITEVPARWTTRPSMLETGDRMDRNAQFVPNHAFSCIIKTMGPKRQKYVTTSPVEVQVISIPGQPIEFKWNIPLSVQFQAQAQWPLPGEDPEAIPGCEPKCEYEYMPARKVALMDHTGDPQDDDISDVRKQLYDKVMAMGGVKPKLDESGRPIFFYWRNDTKACYTQEGLGMVVYEYRPDFTKPNQVGLELEV